VTRLLLFAALAVIASLCFVITHQSLHAQRFQIGGWEIKKSWGPVRGIYVTPGKLPRFVFEDQIGTVRIVEINEENGTAVPVAEMKRQ